MGNPCLAKGTRRDVNVKDEATGVERKVTMDGGDIGSFEACDRVVQLVLAKDAYVPFSSSFYSYLPAPSLFIFSILLFFFSGFLSHPLLLSSPLPSSLSLLLFALLPTNHMHTQNM